MESDGLAVRESGYYSEGCRFHSQGAFDVVSLGKALHSTCLRGNVHVLTVNSLWIRASAK